MGSKSDSRETAIMEGEKYLDGVTHPEKRRPIFSGKGGVGGHLFFQEHSAIMA
jgi:hypothetical protein